MKFRPDDFIDVSQQTRQRNKPKKDLRSLHEGPDDSVLLHRLIYTGLAPWFLAIVVCVGITLRLVYINYGWLGLSLCSLIPVILSVIYYIIKSAREHFNDNVKTDL